MDFGKQQQQQPSVKMHHAPGGQSSFSLAWDDGSAAQQKPKQGTAVTSPFATHEEEKKQVPTSVKYSGQAPGGSATISLGDGSQVDDRFVTQNQANSVFATNNGNIAAGSTQEAAGKKTIGSGQGAVPPGGRSQITF